MSLNLNGPSAFEQAEYVDAPVAPALEVESSALTRAIVFGLAGVLVGAVIYAGFIGITHIQIGYLAIGVAYLVAKAMMIGSHERGGRNYQIAAIALTYLSVAVGNAMLLAWNIHQQGLTIPVSFRSFWLLMSYGVREPFLEFQDSPGGAILGLFILFIGFRAAWRMTSGVPGASAHPFSR